MTQPAPTWDPLEELAGAGAAAGELAALELEGRLQEVEAAAGEQPPADAVGPPAPAAVPAPAPGTGARRKSSIDPVVLLPGGVSLDLDAPPDLGDCLDEFNEQFKLQLLHKEREESEARKVAKAAAEKELDEFFNSKTDERARRQASNREKNAEDLLLIESRHESSTGNPWDSIASMVNLRQDAPGDGRSTVDRARKVIIALKNDPANLPNTRLARRA